MILLSWTWMSITNDKNVAIYHESVTVVGSSTEYPVYPPNRVGIHRRKEKKKSQKREWKEFKCCLPQLIVIIVRYLITWLHVLHAIVHTTGHGSSNAQVREGCCALERTKGVVSCWRMDEPAEKCFRKHLTYKNQMYPPMANASFFTWSISANFHVHRSLRRHRSHRIHSIHHHVVVVNVYYRKGSVTTVLTPDMGKKEAWCVREYAR